MEAGLEDTDLNAVERGTHGDELTP